jgi:hypothetical protein
VDPTEPTATYPGHGFADDLSLAMGSPANMTIDLQNLSLFSAYTRINVNVRKCYSTGKLRRLGNALSLSNHTLLASRLQHHFVTISTHTSTLPSIGPSDTYRVLGVELSTSLIFTKHRQELKNTTTSFINALSPSLLTQFRRLRVIRGLLIGKHFTLKLGLFSGSQLDILEGQICRAVRSAVSSVRNLPRTTLHRPTSDLGYGLPSLKAHAAQLAVCSHFHKTMNTLGFKGHHMARTHIHTISTTYNHWPTESIMSRSTSPPTLRCLVRAQRHEATMLHHIPPLSLTDPIATTLHTHFNRQDDTLLASLRDNATHITDSHTYKQAYCNFTPRRTHIFLLPRLNSHWQNHITTWPHVLLRASSSSIIL